jgi:hypothetical protein
MNRTLMTIAAGVLISGSVLAQQPTPMPGSMPGTNANGMDMKMMPGANDARNANDAGIFGRCRR